MSDAPKAIIRQTLRSHLSRQPGHQRLVLELAQLLERFVDEEDFSTGDLSDLAEILVAEMGKIGPNDLNSRQNALVSPVRRI